LLQISGEDAIDVDRKNTVFWHGTLPTRFLILTNELPRLADASGALVSRFILLCLVESFYGREDRGLTNKLLACRSGILNWALDGYDRLRERGHFVQPKSGEDAVRSMEDLGSPIRAFVRDQCAIEPAGSVDMGDLYTAWVEWGRDQGLDKPGTQQTFGRDLRAAVPGVRTYQPRQGEKRKRLYSGIRLKDARDE
jgi:putative DNA primase/helicase